MLDFEVVIVGGGPTGATAANLLGRRGIRTLVVERAINIHPQQRAIAIDEDALRIWQSLGLLDRMMGEMRTRVTMHLHHAGRIVLSCKLDGKGLQGLPAICFFHQPTIERILRAALPACVTIRAGSELVSLTQGASGVELTLRRTGTIEETRVNARYVIGCDGGSSTTRKLLGIAMRGRTIPEPWIDIQTRTDIELDPADRLDFHFIAEPARPGAHCHAAPGLQRWEFRLHRDEDPSLAGSKPGMLALLASRGVDVTQAEIVQSWIYRFHVLQAERWQQGQVFLCGDAAHIMPPFAGQGLSSGVRDAGNLCWKLASVIRGEAPPALLASYESERRPNVRAVTRFSVRIGAIVMMRNHMMAAVRDRLLQTAARAPWLGARIRNFHIRPEWRAGPGNFTPRPGFRSPAGRLLWQPWVQHSGSAHARLDDVLGEGWIYLAWETGYMPSALRVRGVRQIIVRPQGSSCGCVGADEIVDIEGKLQRQFERHAARGLLVRPDRFIYGSDRDPLRATDVPNAALEQRLARHQSQHQENHEDHQADKEQDLRDPGGSRRNATKTEDAGNDRNDQEQQGKFQHASNSEGD